MYVSGLLVRAEFQEAVLMRTKQKLLTAVHVELAENTGEMMAYGYAGNAETLGNVLVGQCLADQANDRLFTAC